MSETYDTSRVLTVSLFPSGPVELAALSDSLHALAAQHARYATAHGAPINGDVARLYIREIRTGSIIVDLVEMFQTVAGIVQPMMPLIGFAKSLGEMISFFRGHAPALPRELTKRDAEDLVRFLAPVAADPSALLQIQARDNANVSVNLTITSNDANAMQNRARNWLAQNKEPISGIQHDQLFYWFQARDMARGGAGDRGIIEAISPTAVKTIFAGDDAKRAMLDEPLFRKLYVVNVDVQTVDGRPRLYRILQVVNSFDRDDDR